MATALLLICFTGWGKILSRLLRKETVSGIGEHTALGMAMLLILGGVLNLLRLISTISAFLVVAIGLGAALLGLLKSPIRIKLNQSSCRKRALLWGLLLLGLLLVYGGFTSLPALNPHDDLQGYLVFPHQMLQTGGISPDPFNAARVGILGGQSFLNALFLTLVPFLQLSALDTLLGWGLFLLLVFANGRARGLNRCDLIFALIILLCQCPMGVNLSSLNTSLALFYLLFMINIQIDTSTDRPHVILNAIVAAALISLKPVNLVGLVFLSAALFWTGKQRPLQTRFREGITTVGLTLLFLLPWMIALHQSCGTFFYPLLGQGTHAAGQAGAAALSVQWQQLSGTYLLEVLGKVLNQFYIPAGLILLALIRTPQTLEAIRPQVKASFLAASTGAIVLAVISLGFNRYFFAFAFAAFVMLMIEALAATQYPAESRPGNQNRRVRRWIILTLCGYAAFSLPETGTHYKNKLTKAQTVTRLTTAVPHSVVQAPQALIPEGQALLAVLSHPYKLNFENHSVFIIDHAGSGGPGQGLPVFSSARELARYLRQHNLFYILYSYSDGAGYAPAGVASRLKLGGTPALDRIRVITENNLRFRQQLAELSKIFSVIYQDNYSLLIDLNQPQ